MNVSANLSSMTGNYASLHQHNLADGSYDERLFSFVRWNEQEVVIVVANFDTGSTYNFELTIPESVSIALQLTNGEYSMTDLLSEQQNTLVVSDKDASTTINLAPLASVVYRISK
mgnify:CR=1 FL=1